MTKNDKRDPFRIDRRAASRLADLGDKAKGHCQRLDDVGRALGFRDGKTMMGLLKAEEGRPDPAVESFSPTTLLDTAAMIFSGSDEIFVLPEGQKTPSPERMRLLVNVVGFIFSRHGFSVTPATAGIIKMCLEWVYGPHGPAQGSIYHESELPAVDEALRRAGGRLPEYATWAQVAVLLRLCGERDAAYAAQRAASPRFAHLHDATRSPHISALYKDVLTEHGETLLNCFSRIASEVVRDAYVSLPGHSILAQERDGTRQEDIRPWLNELPVEQVLDGLMNDPDWATAAAYHANDNIVLMKANRREAALWLIENRDLSGLAATDQKRLAALAMGASQ